MKKNRIRKTESGKIVVSVDFSSCKVRNDVHFDNMTRMHTRVIGDKRRKDAKHKVDYKRCYYDK